MGYTTHYPMQTKLILTLDRWGSINICFIICSSNKSLPYNYLSETLMVEHSVSTADQENKEQENIVLWNMSKNFMERYLHSVFFCIGIILIFWRSSECLQKYLYNNLSTKIRMDQSYSAVLPSIVLCSLKATAFNKRWMFGNM